MVANNGEREGGANACGESPGSAFSSIDCKLFCLQPPPPPIIFGLGSVLVCVPVCVMYACVCVCKHAHTLLLEGVTAV